LFSFQFISYCPGAICYSAVGFLRRFLLPNCAFG
jgi:hypothetical protein